MIETHTPHHSAVYSADSTLWGKIRRRFSFYIARRPARLRHLTDPMVSITFDDVPVSAAQLGTDILEANGVKGTYFVSGELMGKPSNHLGPYACPDVLKALKNKGHELACHTYSHLDCGRADKANITANIELNAKIFTEFGFGAPETFAYPYGDVSPQAKIVARERFLAARALHKGIVTEGCDLYQAPAVGIEGIEGEATALHWIAKAAALKKAWLILYSHDIREDASSWGASPASLDRIIKTAKSQGLEFVTFSEGAKRAQKP